MGEVSNTAEEARCVLCNVPKDLHGTVCGWENASVEVIGTMIINDVRHPGFGQPLNLWKRTYMDGSEDSYEITEKNSYKFGWDAGVAHASQQTEQLRKEKDYAAEWFGHKLNLAEKEIADLRQQLAEREQHCEAFREAYCDCKDDCQSSPKQEIEQKPDFDPEQIIHRLIGIKPGAGDFTPMDYSECKKCMEAAVAPLQSRIKELEAGNEELKAEVRDLKATLVLRALKD